MTAGLTLQMQLPIGPRELIERADAVGKIREAAWRVAVGESAVVVVHGPPGSGRSALLAEAAAVARQGGLRVVTATCTPADLDRQRGVARDIAANVAISHEVGAGLAILVDDAQWADPDSVRLARAVLSRSGVPLLLIVASHDPIALDVAGTARFETCLRPLSLFGVRRLLTGAYGPRFAGPLVETAVAATGGNPAVLCATLHRCPEPPAPEEFAAVAEQVGNHRVRRILAAFPARTVALVHAAAVGRGDLSFSQITEIAEIPEPQRARARRELARTGLFTFNCDDQDGAERPRPRSPLAADRMLALMDAARRRDLYVRASRIAHRDGAATTVLGRLLTHAHLREPWVLPILYEAGAHARRLGDFTQAVILLGLAIDAGATGALRTEVLVELAMAQLHGAPCAVDRALRRVSAEPSEPGGAAARLVAADLAALIGSRAATELLAAAAPSAQRRTLLGLCRLASDDHSVTDLAPEAEGLPRGDKAAVDKTGVPALDPAEAAATAWRLCVQGRALSKARDLATAVLAAPVGTNLLTPRLAAARVLIIAEEMDAAITALDVTAAEARRRGVPQALAWALLGSADVALRRGDSDRAHALLAEAVTELPRDRWPASARARLTALEVFAAVEVGELDRAKQIVAASEPYGYGNGHGHGLGAVEALFARSLLCLHTGRIDEARALLRECGRLLHGLGCRNPSLVPWRSHLAKTQAAADPDEAAALLTEDLITAQEWGSPGAVGVVHLWTGLALFGQARIKKLRWAVRVLERSPARSYHARALVELSAALLDSGEVASGRWTLSEAIRALEAVGSGPTARAREVAAGYEALAGSARDLLTPAQLRVTLLAAQGQANAQIARELSITRRTVELHLTNSYRTLGVHGRADLAAALGQGNADPEGAVVENGMVENGVVENGVLEG